MNQHAAAPTRATYHHGDLRNALLVAGEAELEEKGIEGFTLRGCAKRAGVSHAAPAHHFRDANGLLTALAEVGFRRFLETQTARQAKAPADPAAQMRAAGLGYIQFAREHPALFRLIFSSCRADFAQPGLAEASKAAFEHLLRGITAIAGKDPRQDRAAMIDAMATWSIVHGLADLMLSEKMKWLAELPPDEREATAAEIIARALPGLRTP